MLLTGHLLVQVEKAGQETVAAQIGEMLNKSASYQMAIATKAMQIADASVKPTFIAAGLALLTVGYSGMVAITSTMFGLSLRISGPMALLTYLNVASRHSILVKDGRSLELLTTIDTVVFDKTGTLTLDQLHVTHVHTFGALTGNEVLAYAAAVEQRQSHPLARAICTAAAQQGLVLPTIKNGIHPTCFNRGMNAAGVLVRTLFRVLRLSVNRNTRREYSCVAIFSRTHASRPQWAPAIVGLCYHTPMKTYKFKLYRSKKNRHLHQQINVSGLIYNHCIALHRRSYRLFGKSLNGYALMKHILIYVAATKGKVVHLISRFYPSSKTCSNCRYVYKELQLSERRWACQGCGVIHDRDLNAALNIHREGASSLGLGDVRPSSTAIAA